MNLEPDLLKEILQWCEDNLPDRDKILKISLTKFGDYSKEQIKFHSKLLFDNGYLEAIHIETNDDEDFIIENLTLNGYQYLNLLRSKAWNNAKGLLHEFGVIFAEAAIRQVISSIQFPNK
jgi:hypothetical protein